MKKLLILLDYKRDFQCSVEDLSTYKSMNIDKVLTYFKSYNYIVTVLCFSDIDLEADYKGVFVLYHSSEDKGLFYKSYIEDICFFLKDSGAILIPNLSYLRAHHNKSFMEMMRYQFKNDKLKTIKSSVYGVFEDALKKDINYPVVLKVAEGAGSNGVVLVHNEKELIKYSCQLLRIIYANSFTELIKKVLGNIFWKKNKRDYTDFRNKFIVQNFIDRLSGDYKVLFYAGKYYILGRKNRVDDFRASGSGILYNVNDDDAKMVLRFSKLVVEEINEPIIGIDIAYDGKDFHLIEFQVGVFIGPYALQFSDHWYEFSVSDNLWKKISGESELEKEYCRAIHSKISEGRHEYIN
jgi:hypothetical protein